MSAERDTGAFQSAHTKTIVVPVARAYAAWEDADLRREWLGEDAGFEIREATPERSLRIAWIDGQTTVSVSFYANGRAKSQVQVIHEGFPDAGTAERVKAYWGERLERLRVLLEGSRG
ncbi:MAG: SRPBCC domain-containing protein [Solirubrobacterales bacterium]